MSYIEISDQKLLEIRQVRFGRGVAWRCRKGSVVQCFVLGVGVDFNSGKIISLKLWSIWNRFFVKCSYELIIP